MTIDIDEQFLVECAQALVRAPSENPPGDERAAAAAAAAFCEAAGLHSEIVETAERRHSVIATLDSGRPGRTLAWNGHIDVVPIVDAALWKHPPFDAVVTDGVLHGRGSADMKGACAAAIAAARALREAGGPAAGRVELHLVADEEVLGPHGTQALWEQGRVNADAIIVGEPTDLVVAIAERGMLWVQVRTEGVSGHGSQPHLGRSAIEEMARVVLALRGMTWDDPHPILGPPTLNVGTISGGAKINIIPAQCEIEVDRRTIPGETPESVEAEMLAALRDAGATATIDVTRHAEPFELSPDEEIVRLALESYEAVKGAPGRTGAMTATTDAYLLVGRAKIPTIVFGPGSLDQAHTTSEHVRISELCDAARIYARMFDRFLQQ